MGQKQSFSTLLMGCPCYCPIEREGAVLSENILTDSLQFLAAENKNQLLLVP